MDRSTFLNKGREFKRATLTLDEIGEVHVREVSAADSGEYGKKIKAGDELEAAAWLCTRVLCDEQGTLILSDADIPTVRAMPLRVLKKISEKSEELSGLRDEDRKNASAN